MPLKPVVFIPGFPASELRQTSRRRTIFPPSLVDLLDREKKKELVRLLVGPDEPPGDIVAGEPIRGVMDVAKQAQSLYDILQQHFGYTVQGGDDLAPIGWDWRLAVDHPKVQDDIVQAIDRLSQEHGRKVVVLIHSTGGLVLRALLEQRPEVAAKIERILAFGIPWAGTLKAFLYVAQGEPFGLAIAGQRIVGFSKTEVRDLMSHCQAAYDLFPPDPAKSDLRGADGKGVNLFMVGNRQAGPLVDLSWIPSGPSRDFIRDLAGRADQRLGSRSSEIRLPGGGATPPITNVVGWGVETDTRCTLADGGNFELGPPTKEGDGTVALVSAAWLRGPGVRTFFIPIGVYPTNGIPNPHSRIWDSPPVLDLFHQVLADKAPEPFVCAAADGDQAIDRRSDVTLRLAAADENGNALPNAKAAFPGFPGARAVAFGSSPRKEIVLRRGNLRGNAAPDLFRFVVNVTWGTAGAEDSREIPVLIRV
jgi:pimeloyl-ACP methyl ester carboxylesterase